MSCSEWGNTNGFVDPIAYLRDRTPEGTTPPTSCDTLSADRSLVRERGTDAVYVMAGGAAFHFRSRSNLETAGHFMDAVCEVDPGWMDARARFPRDGTHLQGHNSTGVRTVAGRALFGWTSADAFRAAGHGFDRVVRIDAAHVSADGRFVPLPDGGTHLQPHDGPGVHTVAGGALFGWTAADDFRAAGHDFNTVVRVQSNNLGPDSRFTTIPADGTVLTELATGTSWSVMDGYRQTTSESGTVIDGRHLDRIPLPPAPEETDATDDAQQPDEPSDPTSPADPTDEDAATSPDRYCPTEPVSRAQMASFLYRATSDRTVG